MIVQAITKKILQECFGATLDPIADKKTMVIRLGGMAIWLYERKGMWLVSRNVSDSVISREFRDDDLDGTGELLDTVPELIDYMMRVSRRAGVVSKVNEIKNCFEL